MNGTPILRTGQPAGARPAADRPAGRVPDRGARRVGAVRAAVGVLAAVLALTVAGCSDDGGSGGSDSGSGSGSTVEE